MANIDPWKLRYASFDAEEEGLREALCTLGNGYFATRGAAAETAPTEAHYPGTYIAGVYNRLGTHISGRMIYNEDMVNCPNWLYLTFRIRDGVWFSPSSVKILEYYQELDMRAGILFKNILFQTRFGHRTRIRQKRIVHMNNPHAAALEYTIIPENYSDYISVRSMLDGAVLNMNVERYRQLNFNHWKAHTLGAFSRNGVYLGVKTSQSGVGVYEAAKLRVFLDEKEKDIPFEVIRHGEKVVGQEFRLFVNKKQPFRIEKTVSIFTSRDKGISKPKHAAINCVKNLPSFKKLLESHREAWEDIWSKFDIVIKGDDFSQKVLRLHIFHLMQTVSGHNTSIDAGLPARGLHGEAYRGHVFWDEIFVLPFLNRHMPEISKAMLMYRYRRLAQAREYALENGYQGAMFPWQSGSSGSEETQVVHLNPRSGKWGPDYSRYQRHVSFAIAYNIWDYWKVTGDLDFMENYGAEVLLSVAQFASSLSIYDPKDSRFHIERVMGPDEFHEKISNSSRPGLRDNAYTNFMVVWTLLRAKEIISLISKDVGRRIMEKLKISSSELKKWDQITGSMNIIFNSKGIISQFDGYFKLKELDLDRYRKKYKKTARMDRILKAEGKSPDVYKVSKQADVLMIFYLFSYEEVKDVLGKMGYSCDRQMIRNNYDYYSARTSHGSTLSKVVHCFLSRLVGKERDFWDWFQDVLKSDIYDTQGGTTPEGIHAGVMGGSLDIVMRCFAGIEICADRVRISPKLPRQWSGMKLKVAVKGQWLVLNITRQKIIVELLRTRTHSGKFDVEIRGKKYTLAQGKKAVFSVLR